MVEIKGINISSFFDNLYKWLLGCVTGMNLNQAEVFGLIFIIQGSGIFVNRVLWPVRRSYLVHHLQPGIFVIVRNLAAVVPVKWHIKIFDMKQVFRIGDEGLPVAGQPAQQ